MVRTTAGFKATNAGLNLSNERLNLVGGSSWISMMRWSITIKPAKCKKIIKIKNRRE